MKMDFLNNMKTAPLFDKAAPAFDKVIAKTSGLYKSVMHYANIVKDKTVQGIKSAAIALDKFATENVAWEKKAGIIWNSCGGLVQGLLTADYVSEGKIGGSVLWGVITAISLFAIGVGLKRRHAYTKAIQRGNMSDDERGDVINDLADKYDLTLLELYKTLDGKNKKRFLELKGKELQI
ncbi:MAG: hypothetical protein FWC51_03920 [Proteobacteria bacterium]|nr:hypothetical protein [Pseudomonadota bacterium]